MLICFVLLVSTLGTSVSQKASAAEVELNESSDALYDETAVHFNNLPPGIKKQSNEKIGEWLSNKVGVPIKIANDHFIFEEIKDGEYVDYEKALEIEYENGFYIVEVNEVAPRFWGLIGKVVLKAGKYVVKVGQKIYKAQKISKAQNALKSFKSANINIGSGKTVVLQKSSMEHILINHHPKYWTGSKDKTLFNPDLSISDIRSMAISIVNKGRSDINSKGYGVITKKVDGQNYKLVVKAFRVTTFYPF